MSVSNFSLFLLFPRRDCIRDIADSIRDALKDAALLLCLSADSVDFSADSVDCSADSVDSSLCNLLLSIGLSQQSRLPAMTPADWLLT